MAERDPYYRTTKPFTRNGKKEVVEVVAEVGRPPTIRRRRWQSDKVLAETNEPVNSCGCYIQEIGASPSGEWAVTQRNSGQGEWGYDVFRIDPLARDAGVNYEKGYILELPSFAPDESFIVGGAGPEYLGGWWRHPDDEVDDPPRGGEFSLGFLFVHRLPSHEVTRHELRVEVPVGWRPDDPWGEWHGPQEITVTRTRVRLVPSWGVSVEVKFPLPSVIWLPTPHPSGNGLLKKPPKGPFLF